MPVGSSAAKWISNIDWLMLTRDFNFSAYNEFCYIQTSCHPLAALKHIQRNDQQLQQHLCDNLPPNILSIYLVAWPVHPSSIYFWSELFLLFLSIKFRIAFVIHEDDAVLDAMQAWDSTEFYHAGFRVQSRSPNARVRRSHKWNNLMC